MNQAIEIRLWKDCDKDPHLVGTYKVREIPKIGEAVALEDGRHFRIKNVVHFVEGGKMDADIWGKEY